MIKVNLGCGYGWKCEGWIGVDYDETSVAWRDNKQTNTSQYINCNVLEGLPFDDNSVDVIYASHILEHFTYQEVHVVLCEINRVLKPQGVLAIIVPNMDFYINAYINRDIEILHEADIIGGEVQRTLTDCFLMNFYSEPTFNNTCHKYSYNVENLSALLLDLQFEDVNVVEFQKFTYYEEVNGETFRPLPIHADVFSLCIECRKKSANVGGDILEICKNVQKNMRVNALMQALYTSRLELKSEKNYHRYEMGMLKEEVQIKNAQITSLNEEIIIMRKVIRLLLEEKMRNDNEFCRRNDYQKKMSMYSDFILWGAGEAARKVYNKYLYIKDKEKIRVFDNDDRLWGELFKEEIIIEKPEFVYVKESTLFILAFINNDMDKLLSVYIQLKAMLIDDDNILIINMNSINKTKDLGE